VISVASTSIVKDSGAPWRFQKRPRPRVRAAQPLEQLRLRRDPVDHPERRRIRGHYAEQRLLVTHRAEVADALTAVGEHRRQITDHPARIVTPAALLQASQPQRQSAREPELVGHLREQRRVRVRDQTVSVRCDLYREIAAIALHL
jgi:hypothetical protein